jgi:ABC-type multidrug transport system fused ATPase/permease subunit
MEMMAMKGLNKKSQEASAEATKGASEAAENIRTVASFCTQERHIEKYAEQLKATFFPLEIFD